MGAITRSAPLALATVATLAMWSPVAAQSASAASRDACSLLTGEEVRKLVIRGRETYGVDQSPEVMSLPGGGSVCHYPIGGQVILFSGPKAQSDFEALLKSYKVDQGTRHPVSGVGDQAYIMFLPRRYQSGDDAAMLATRVGRHSLGVSLDARQGRADGPMMEYCRRGQLSKEECADIEADKSETAESLRPALVEMARAAVAKLR